MMTTTRMIRGIWALTLVVGLAIGAAGADVIDISLTTDGLGLGSTEINYAGNGSAVEADRPGKLVTSTFANIGSVLTIQADGKAGPGDAVNPLLMTVTARSHIDVLTADAPAGYDFQGGVITLTDEDNNLPKEGLGVRAFGIDMDTNSPTYGRRYVNSAYTGTNTHGFQMEGSKEVSGGYPLIDGGTVYDTITWAQFDALSPDTPGNNPPHVDEEVFFDINDAEMIVAADSLKIILTKIKAGSGAMDLSINLTINLVGGKTIDNTYDYLSDAPDVFSLKAGYTDVVEIDFGAASLGLLPTQLIDSFTIGARHDLADDPKETDEHFLINAVTVVPEPASMGLLAMGGMAMMVRRRRN